MKTQPFRNSHRAKAKAVFTPRQRRSLVDIYADALHFALDVQFCARHPDPQAMHEQLSQELDVAGSQVLAAGFNIGEMRDARSAVAAYIDEYILNSDHSMCEFWQTRPLQLDLYGGNLSREGFLERLEELRQAPEHHYRLLELYSLCLTLGFKGRYRLEGSETLNNISANLAQEITRLRGHMVLCARRPAFHLCIVRSWTLLILLILLFG